MSILQAVGAIPRPVVAIGDLSVLSSGGLACTYALKSDGNIEAVGNGSTTDEGDWVTPRSMVGPFEARATLSSGQTPDVGTLDTWQALSTTRTYGYSSDGGNSGKSCTLSIQIRYGSGTVVDTASISFSVSF